MDELVEGVLQLFDRGGLALWAIVGCSIWMWFSLAECFLRIAADRYGRGSREDRAARLRQIEDRVAQVRAVVPVPPLLGLLGTVVGMIQAFDALSVFGNANPRSLSFGISRALLTTMAGLVTSVLVLFALTPIGRWLDAVRHRADGPKRDALAFSPLLALRESLRSRSVGSEETAP